MIGEKLGDRYEIGSELGRGGMGVVYQARDPVLNRDVAIKIIAPSMLTPETEQRFQTEAQVIAQLDHPSIVPIFDFGKHEGSLFFVMPVVEGDSLRKFMRDGSLNLGDVVDIGAACAEALGYSHGRGIVHRDIKPENVMVRMEGGAPRIRIMDFGLARGGNISSLTKTGMLMGTMSYISPEQVTGSLTDGRTDLYSLGCVLYECLVGEVPFTGEMQTLLYRVAHEIPQPPRALGCDIDAELEEIVLACLEKEPSRRPKSGDDLARTLRNYRGRLRDSQRQLSMMMTQTIAAPRPVQSPFVGREAEFKELQQKLNAAVRGECQFVAISGEPGVGKSRLLDELTTLAAARQVRVLRGRFFEQHGAFPYHGFCEIVQEFFRQREIASSAGEELDLSDLAPDLIALFPMLSEIEAIRAAGTGASVMTQADASRGAENRTEVFELLARTLIRLAGGHPMVLVCEDLHGAEASVEALQYIVRRLGPTPTLIIATYRSPEIDRSHPLTQLLDGFRGDRRFTAIELGPMPREEHREFLSTLTGGNRVSEDLARKLYEATEGNPFFTKELVRSLLDSGSIAQDETGAWSLSGGTDISSEALPATIQQAVETRIGRLPDDLRTILSVASVMGKTFEFKDLDALAASDEDLDEAVDRLIQEGLLEEDRQSRGDRLAFTSAVVREVLYAELSRRKRRSLHRKYAERLEKRHGGRLERVYPQLLYHFYEGDEPEKTVEYGLQHARKSLEAFSSEEAVRAAKTALEFCDEDWEGDRAIEGELRLLLAEGHRIGGELAAAMREIEAAVKVFDQIGDKERSVGALLVAARTAWRARQPEEARRWVDRGLEATRDGEPRETRLQLLSLAATLANLRGDYGRGNEYLKEVERLGGGAEEGKAREEMPQGGRLIVAMANPIAARAPFEIQLTEESEVLSCVMEPLLRTDDQGNVHPSLCERWEVDDYGKVVRLELSPKAKFQDGSPVDAQAVKSWFEYALRSVNLDLPPALAAIEGAAAAQSGDASEVSGLVVGDARTLEIRLSEPLPIYPALLTDARTGIARVPAGDSSEPLVGTGPFRLVEQSRDRVVIEKNADYWQDTAPNVDAVEFRTIRSSSEIASAFRAGDLDVARDLLPQDLEEILRERRYQNALVEAPQKFTYMVLFNARGPLTSNPQVREALAANVRARDLVWQTLGRFGAPAVGVVPPGILGHDPGRRRPTLGIDEARQLLAEAGHADGLKLKAAVHPLIQDRYGSLLEGLLEAWAEIGVELEIEPRTIDQYLEVWHDSSGIDLMVTRWTPDVDDPDDCTHTLFHSERGQLRAWFSSAETDEILEAARRESRPEIRQGLYRRFESQLLDGNYAVPLFHDIGYRLVGPRVRGLVLRSVQPLINYDELGKAEEASTVGDAPRLATGTLHVPMSGRIEQLDPMTMELVEEGEVLPCIYETLIREVGEARFEPWLAERVGVEQGGRRYRFHLRPDVTFHDGRRFTARDVRYSLERLLQTEASEARSYFAPIVGATDVLSGNRLDLEGFAILSALEFTIDLERPLGFLPVLLASPHAAIVPEGTTTVGHSYREGAVGTGPFRVVGFQPRQRLELERYPGYWQHGLPRADALTFSFGMSPDRILSDFKAGRLSLAADLFPGDVERLRRDPEYAAGYRETPRLSTYYVAFNANHGPLADVELRRKLLHSVDVPRLVRQTLGSLALPAAGIIPPGLPGHDPIGMRRDPGHRSKAVDTRIELSAAVHQVYTTEYATFSRELARAFGEVGLPFDFKEQSTTEAIAMAERAEADIYLTRWIADYADADTFVSLAHREEGAVGPMVGRPELDELIEQGRAETDPSARHAIYRHVEEILAREALLLPLFHENVYRFARPEVEGLSLSCGAPAVSYARLQLRRG